MSQVLDQTLLLAQGLKAASARAATVAEGGWSAQDVEAIIHSSSAKAGFENCIFLQWSGHMYAAQCNSFSYSFLNVGS